MSKYYFKYRVETVIEADSLKEAKEAFDAMELPDLTASCNTYFIELTGVEDEGDNDLTAEYDKLWNEG